MSYGLVKINTSKTQVLLIFKCVPFRRVTYVNKGYTIHPVAQVKNIGAFFGFMHSHTLYRIYYIRAYLFYLQNIFSTFFYYSIMILILPPLSLTWTTEIVQ